MPDQLELSVVIASGAGGEFLFRCLDSLEEQVAAHDAQVVVVDRVGGDTRARVEKDHPWVEVVVPDVDHRPSVPELRAAGMRAARGEVVAVLEEHCTAPAGWLDALRDGWREGDTAVGGPILDDRYGRLRDWVVYFSEYHNYLPPWPEGDHYGLNGANIAYHRPTVLANADVLDKGYWEVVLHPRLHAAGRMRALPGMGAYHTGPFDYGYYLGQRYLLSRVWGGTRRSEVSFAKRLVYLVLGPVIPFLLLARIFSRVLKGGGRLVLRFLACLPLLVPVVCAYTLGEWLGYLLGPGDALERVE